MTLQMKMTIARAAVGATLVLAPAHAVAQELREALGAPRAPSAQGRPMQVPAPVGTTPSVPDSVGIDGEQPITLEDAILRVLEDNLALALSRVDVERARLSADGTLGALDPVFGWQSSYHHRVSPVTSFLGGSTTGSLAETTMGTSPGISGLFARTGATYQAQLLSQRVLSTSRFLGLNPQFPTALTLSVTQPLLRNLRVDATRHQIAVAQKAATLSTHQFRQQVMAVVAATEQAYWELVFATRNRSVQIEGLRLAQEQAASSARRASAGTLAAIDATEALTQVTKTQRSVHEAQQRVSAAEVRLKTLMLPDRDASLWRLALIPTTPPDARAPTLAVDEAIRQALAQRPELDAADVSTSINETDVRLFTDQTKPEVNLVASYTSNGLSGRTADQAPISIGDFTLSYTPPAALVGGVGQSLTNLLKQRYPTTQLRIDVTVPLGNRTAKANRASALARGRQLRLERTQLEQAIAADVRNAMQAVASAQAQVSTAADAQRFAEDLYASVERRFQAGATTVFFLLQRQTTMVEARAQLARAEADLGIAISQLSAATGATLRARNVLIRP
jgi:outer membrane protein TolC